MSKTIQNRFNISDKICPICGNKINNISDAAIFKSRQSRYMKYTFIHKTCITYNEVSQTGERIIKNGEF